MYKQGGVPHSKKSILFAGRNLKQDTETRSLDTRQRRQVFTLQKKESTLDIHRHFKDK